MVTQITLGSFGQLNGKNVLTGGASQLDTQALIKALTDAKRAPAVRLEDKNKVIDSQTTAYTSLKTLFKKFQDAANTLRNPPGVAIDSQNIFQYRKATVTSSIGLSASNYLDVTVEPGALSQTYTVDSITQLAKASKQQTDVFSLADTTTASAVAAAATPGMFTAGTFNLRAVDGTVGGIPITLNTGDTLQTVASKFNEVSSRTGIQASILTVANGSYRLVFSATQTGTTYGFNFNTASPTAGYAVETDPSGVLSSVTFNAPTQTAQDAIFSVDGISLTRESNAVSDAIDGVTFNLKQDGFTGTMDVAISPDTTLVSNAITQFADAYNEFRVFVAEQNQLDENSQPTEDAVLYNSQLLRTLSTAVATEVSRIISGITGSDPSQLSDVGITLDDFAGDSETVATSDILVIDTDVLSAALQSNFEGVRQLFEFQLTSDNVNFVNTKRSNKLDGVNSFSVAIDRTLGTYKATYTDPITSAVTTVDLDATVLSSGGVGLKGQTGTIFEGSEFVFAASGDATITVSVTQGIADRFYNLINDYINDTDGTIQNELDSLDDTKTRYEDQITTINDRVDRYQLQLTDQYAKLEAAITKANQILLLLDAQSNANANG